MVTIPGYLLRFLPAFAAACGMLGLASCMRSEGPLLPDAAPLLGQQIELHPYELTNGAVHPLTPENDALLTLRWNGTQYNTLSSGSSGSSGFTALTLHPLGGNDFLVQAFASHDPKEVDYALWRRVVDGVYLVSVSPEDDAPTPLRSLICGEEHGFVPICIINTRDKLLSLMGASAPNVQKFDLLLLHITDRSQPPDPAPWVSTPPDPPRP